MELTSIRTIRKDHLYNHRGVYLQDWLIAQTNQLLHHLFRVIWKQNIVWSPSKYQIFLMSCKIKRTSWDSLRILTTLSQNKKKINLPFLVLQQRIRTPAFKHHHYQILLSACLAKNLKLQFFPYRKCSDLSWV